MNTPGATVTATRTGAWQTRPGWGITTDLTPPEIIEEREVARTRRRLLIALVGLLLLVLVAFGLAFRHHAAAESSLEQEQATADQLRARAAEFRDVTDMQRILGRLQGQTATAMAGDVDLEALTRQLTTNLTPGMRITSESVSLTPAGTGTAAAATPDPNAVAGQPTTIGTVTLVGTGRTLDDLAAYVEKLQRVEGFADVVPTSNTASDKGVQFNVTLNLTSDLLSHRFDQQGATP